MSNKTEIFTVTLYSYAAYLVQGAIVAPANLLVALAMLRYTALRRKKEYIILMALSFADAINMIAYVSGGAYRIYRYFEIPRMGLVPSRFCLKILHIFLWSFCDTNAQLMLLVISVDRLISVALPIKYIKLSKRYALKMVFLTYGFTICMGILGYYLSYNRPQIAELSPNCYTNMVLTGTEGIGLLYGKYYLSYASQLFAILSIAIFALVPPVYAYQKNRYYVGTSEDEKRKLKQQRKVTKSMAISCLCTLLIFVIPYRLGYVVFAADIHWLAFTLWAFSNNNALCNVFIYILRHPEIRLAVRSMLKWKELPPNVNLWNIGE